MNLTEWRDLNQPGESLIYKEGQPSQLGKINKIATELGIEVEIVQKHSSKSEAAGDGYNKEVYILR
jgi:hypothetical protein